MPFFKKELESSFERKVALLTALLFLHLLLISSQIVLRNNKTLLATVMATVASPFQVAANHSAQAVGEWFRKHLFLKGIYLKYQDLRAENLKLKLEHYRLQRHLRDYQALQGVRKELPAFVLANVIAVDANFPLHSLTIDRGTGHGISENDTVVNRDGDLVGRIVHPISPMSATVRLITSPVGGVGAYLRDDLLEGFLSGTNTTVCLFKYLIENKLVHSGTQVITSGTDQIFPPYLPIGRVISIEKDFLTQIIRVKPFFVDKPLKHLLVLPNENN